MRNGWVRKTPFPVLSEYRELEETSWKTILLLESFTRGLIPYSQSIPGLLLRIICQLGLGSLV